MCLAKYFYLYYILDIHSPMFFFSFPYLIVFFVHYYHEYLPQKGFLLSIGIIDYVLEKIERNDLEIEQVSTTSFLAMRMF